MAISARYRRGTSPSFWRNHNAMQMMMAQACMPSVRPSFSAKSERVLPLTPVFARNIDSAPKVFIAKV